MVKQIFFKNDPFLQDLKRAQIISGITAASAIIITVIVLTIIPISRESIRNIWIIGAFAGSFTAFYYLNPRIYSNTKYVLFIDTVYTISIALVMRILGDFGHFYIIFFLIMIAINAFVYNLKNFTIGTFLIVIGLLFASFPIKGNPNVFYYKLIFELYGIITLSIVLRIFATEALRLKEKKKELEKLNVSLETERQELKNIFDNIAEIIIYLDPKGRTIFLNEKAIKTFSLENKKVIGKKIDEFINLINEGGRVYLSDLAAKKRGPSIRSDLRLIAPEETKTFITTVSPLFDSEKNYQGSIIFMHDTTKERILEKKKSEFIAVASHELRTPLTVIEGYLHFLLTNKELKYDNQTRKYLENIYNSTLDLIELSKNILEASKADEGSLTVEIKKTNIENIIKNIIKENKERIKKKGLKLFLKIENTIPTIKTDPLKVREIFSNLLDNAIKFTPKGSISVGLKKLEKTVLISVKDTGVGIDEESQKMIFQKFFRAGDWQIRSVGGTGLGLYVVKTLVERLGGNIKFISQKNKGSEFMVTLPILFSEIKTTKKESEKELKSFMKSL